MDAHSMKGDDNGKRKQQATSKPHQCDVNSTPDWAEGLRQLYDSVVNEPLPDSFKELLDKLENSDSDGMDTDSKCGDN